MGIMNIKARKVVSETDEILNEFSMLQRPKDLKTLKYQRKNSSVSDEESITDFYP